MPTVRDELRALIPAWAVMVLLPVPLLNFVGDGTGRALAFAYLYFGCALLAAECFRQMPEAGGRVRWDAKMTALAAALAFTAALFSVCYWAVGGGNVGNATVLAFLVVVPAWGVVPCLTLLVGSPYAAVVLGSLLLVSVKLAGCVAARMVYGPTAQADGQMAMSWDEPNLLVWFCLVGGLTCSAVLGALGFRLASTRGAAVS